MNGTADAVSFFVLGEYREICKHRYQYTLANGEQVCIVFKPQNFVHLAGLRKLNDLYEFQQCNSAVNIYKKILSGSIDMYTLQNSVNYHTDARERIENLCRLDCLLQTKRVVWQFDRNKTYVHTNLKSKVILFRDDGFDFYLMLGAVDNGKTYYPETFFLRYDAAYIRGQQIVPVEKIELL